MWCLNLSNSKSERCCFFFRFLVLVQATGHAVLRPKLNVGRRWDMRKRSFANNENNICRNVQPHYLLELFSGVWAGWKPHEPLPENCVDTLLLMFQRLGNTDAMRGEFTPRSEGFIQLENNTYLPASDDKTRTCQQRKTTLSQTFHNRNIHDLCEE